MIVTIIFIATSTIIIMLPLQEEFEQPSEQDLKRIEANVNEESDDDYNEPGTNNWRLRHITETTILTVQLIVEFSKRLPGFQSLCREDQITLLKACSSEVSLPLILLLLLPLPASASLCFR